MTTILEHNGGPDYLAQRLISATDTSTEAVFIAEAVRRAIEDPEFKERFGTFGVETLKQYMTNSLPNQD